MFENSRRIEASELVLGTRFSEPLYFDDGINMFLATNHPLRQHHLDTLYQWNIPHVVTSGYELLFPFEGFHADTVRGEDIPELESVV